MLHGTEIFDTLPFPPLPIGREECPSPSITPSSPCFRVYTRSRMLHRRSIKRERKRYVCKCIWKGLMTFIIITVTKWFVGNNHDYTWRYRKTLLTLLLSVISAPLSSRSLVTDVSNRLVNIRAVCPLYTTNTQVRMRTPAAQMSVCR